MSTGKLNIPSEEEQEAELEQFCDMVHAVAVEKDFALGGMAVMGPGGKSAHTAFLGPRWLPWEDKGMLTANGQSVWALNLMQFADPVVNEAYLVRAVVASARLSHFLAQGASALFQAHQTVATMAGPELVKEVLPRGIPVMPTDMQGMRRLVEKEVQSNLDALPVEMREEVEKAAAVAFAVIARLETRHKGLPTAAMCSLMSRLKAAGMVHKVKEDA